MAHFFKGGTDRDSVLGIDESGSGFGFLDGGHDSVDDFAVDENRCIERWSWVVVVDGYLWFLGEIEISTVAGACFGFIEIGGISVKPEMHFGGFVLDASIGVSGSIIEKLVDAEFDVFPRTGGDGRSNGANRGLHGVVDGASVVIEDAGKFLTVFDLSGRELTGGAGRFGKLLFLAVHRSGMGMW